MAELTLRLTGRPKIERDSSGLRKITRTYIVQGSSVTQEKIEKEVFLPYGTPDEEYNETITQDLTNGGLTDSEVTGAYLVQQEVAPGNSMSEATLVRVYQELDASSEPVKVGSDKITRGENDRLSIAKTFIVKNPYDQQYAQNRIGVESLELQGSVCFLGSVQSEVNEVYTQFTETYYEDGILSESISYRYGQYPNHKLEVRTVRSVATPQTPPDTEGPGEGPWVRVESKEGPGNSDFGQSGKTIKTVVFAKGEGLIKTSSQVKGKEPNTVEVLTIQYLTGENGEVPDEEIPNFTRRTLQSVDEKEGYEIHTIGGVVLSSGSGVVDAKVEYKYGKKPDHKLEVANVVSYGVPATSQAIIDFVYPDGDTTSLGDYVLVSEREDTKDEIDEYTSVYARGSGVISTDSRKVGLTTVSQITSLHPSSPDLPTAISGNELKREVTQLDGYQRLVVTTTTELSGVVDEREEIKNNGKLRVSTITQLGSEWLSQNKPYDSSGNYTLISERNHTYDTYPAITRVYALGSGVVQESVRKVGLTEILESVTLYDDDEELPTELLANELKREIRQEDGYQILSVSRTTGLSGIVDKKVDTRNNGALVITNATQLGSEWTSGSYGALISEREHTYDTYPAITRVFATGSGEIASNYRKVGSNIFRESTTLSQTEPKITDDLYSYSVQNEDGYYVLRATTLDSDNKIIDIKEEERLQGALKFKTFTTIGDSWDKKYSPQGYYELSLRKHTYENLPAITKTFVTGRGIIDTQESEDAYFTKNRVTYLSQDDTLPKGIIPDDAVEIKVESRDGYYLYSYSTLEAHTLENTDFSWSNGIKRSEASILNSELDYEEQVSYGNLLAKNRKKLDSKNFINNYTFLEVDENLVRRKENYLPGREKVVEEVLTDEENLPKESEDPEQTVVITNVKKIAENLYESVVETTTPTDYANIDNSYRRGVRFVTERILVNEVTDKPEDFDNFEQQKIDKNLHSVTKTYAIAVPSFLDERKNQSKFKNSTTKVVIDSYPYHFNYADGSLYTLGEDGVTSLSINQESKNLYSKTSTIEEPSNFKEVQYSTTFGGGVLVKRTSELKSPDETKSALGGQELKISADDYSKLISQSFIDDNLGSVITTEEYEVGNWYSKKVKDSKTLRVETIEDLFKGSASDASATFEQAEDNRDADTETSWSIEQVAPKIFKRSKTVVTKTTDKTDLRYEEKFVLGGKLISRSRVNDRPRVGSGNTEVSRSVTFDMLDGVAVDIHNLTEFQPEKTTYTLRGNKTFGMPSVVGIDSNGIFVIGGYATTVAAKATITITNEEPNITNQSYTPPSVAVSYTATPAAFGSQSISSSQNIQNAVKLGGPYNKSNSWFRGIYCSNVSSTLTGITMDVFKQQVKGRILSDDVQIIATYGKARVYKRTKWEIVSV